MQPTTDEIFAALRTCRTPEIPVHLGELGLVHGAGVSALRSAACENRRFALRQATDCRVSEGMTGKARRPSGMVPLIRRKIGCGFVMYSGLLSAEGLHQFAS